MLFVLYHLSLDIIREHKCMVEIEMITFSFVIYILAMGDVLSNIL